MQIEINSKKYDYNKLYLVDSISHFEWQEYIYYTENLFISENGEYVLETSWQLNPKWAKSGIEDGTISQEDLEPKTEYKLMCTEEKEAWLEESVWEV